MTRETDNEAFARHVQRWLGITPDGWAGKNTVEAFDKRVGLEIPESVSFDGAAFFDVVRSWQGKLEKEQVEGYEYLLKAMSKWGLYDTAYGLATAFWETNKTMQPVREAYWLSEAWRKKNLRYYPWYGRGFVQITWAANYEKADKELGLSGTLVGAPDRALEPDIAARIMVVGMEQGWFTGKKNSDYSGRQYVERRKIINGTDKAAEIAAVATTMESALEAGGWS